MAPSSLGHQSEETFIRTPRSAGYVAMKAHGDTVTSASELPDKTLLRLLMGAYCGLTRSN